MQKENDKYQTPTQSLLENKALDFVKKNKPKYYNDLKKSRRLKEYSQHRATKAMSRAKLLISNGMSDEEAWNRAINQEILEIRNQ